MVHHKRVYIEFFYPGANNYDIILPCEICGKEAVDIHHISPRGMGGSKNKDDIENLMALCRSHHDKAEAEGYSEHELSKIHRNFIDRFLMFGL